MVMTTVPLNGGPIPSELLPPASIINIGATPDVEVTGVGVITIGTDSLNFEVVGVGVAVVGTDALSVVVTGVGVVMVGTGVGVSMVVCVGTVVRVVVTVIPPSVEVIGVGVVEVDVGVGVGMLVFVRGCGGSGPKGLVGTVLEMVLFFVQMLLEADSSTSSVGTGVLDDPRIGYKSI